MKIFAHNFSGYDSHLIIEKLSHPSVTSVSVIPKSGEKFMTVEINNTFTICDSMMFLVGSLDSLSKSLPKDHKYSLLKQSTVYRRLPHAKYFDVLFEKWKFPYEYAQSMDDIEKTKKLPNIECFHNSLTGETISDEEYKNTEMIFNFLKCENLKEYMEFYCMLDVYLLAEVFTEFRKESLENFEIDPCNFVSLPGMGLQCFLKTSGVELDYIYKGMILSLNFLHSNVILK
jgi:DNA polymerase type B, organellar and viral